MHTHKFVKSKFNGYEKCVSCGSYHSIAQEKPETIYEEKEYWGDGTGRSTLDQQVSNLTCIDECGISKVDRIMQFVPRGERVLEIACAPGVLLKRLIEYGYSDAIGIEPSEKYFDFIGGKAPGATLIKGYFPQVLYPADDNLFHCIVGMDVMEHVDDYDDFFRTTHRLLLPGGVAVFMSPIILNDGLFRKIDLEHPDEHCWIHTQKFLEPYLKEIFREVKFSRWICGHEVVILAK